MLKISNIIKKSILLSYSIFITSILIANPIQSGYIIEQKKDEIIFNNKTCKLIYSKQNATFKLFNKTGILLYSEYRSPSFFINKTWIEPKGNIAVNKINDKESVIKISTNKNVNFTVSVSQLNDHGFKIYIRSDSKAEKIKGLLKLNPVEEIYGFGEMWNGHVAQRGQSFKLWNQSGTPDECAYMPYFVSTNNYAFFLNYGGEVNFDIGKRKSDEIVFEAPANELDYTLVSGENIPNVVKNFFSSYGMPAKPPRWSYKPWFWLMANPFNTGNGISEPPFNNYKKPKEDVYSLKGDHFLRMIDTLNQLQIPIGVTWLEPMWQDARTSFIPDKNFTPDLKKLIQQITDKGVKTLAWTVPYTTKNSFNFKDAVKNNFLAKNKNSYINDEGVTITNSGEALGSSYNYIDFYNPQAYKWWQKQIEAAIDLGLSGFKLDAGQDLATDAILYGDINSADVHNSYSLQYNKVFYDALKNKLGDDFLMITRAAWMGSAPYINSKWPGDLMGSFGNNGLPSSVYSSLSLAFCGIPFVSTDIGGFANQPASEQVFIRWAQFGAFLPSMQTLHMPWWYSKKAMEHYRFLSWLHTDLTPYWSTLANEAHTTATPIIRPLVWDYQSDIETWRVDDEFIVGESILVAPVIDTREYREVYLPKGNWFSFWNDSLIKGKKKINWTPYQSTMWKFPLYIKEGAIIPMSVSNSYSGFGNTASNGYMTMCIWPKQKGSSSFELNDLKGKIRFNVIDNEKNTTINCSNLSDDYIYRVHYKSDKAPQGIELKESGKNIILNSFQNFEDYNNNLTDGWFYDKGIHKIWIRIHKKNTSAIVNIMK